MHSIPARSTVPAAQLRRVLRFRIYYEARKPSYLEPCTEPSSDQGERELGLFESGHAHWVCADGADSHVYRTACHELVLVVFDFSDASTMISRIERSLIAHGLRGQQLG